MNTINRKISETPESPPRAVGRGRSYLSAVCGPAALAACLGLGLAGFGAGCATAPRDTGSREFAVVAEASPPDETFEERYARLVAELQGAPPARRPAPVRPAAPATPPATPTVPAVDPAPPSFPPPPVAVSTPAPPAPPAPPVAADPASPPPPATAESSLPPFPDSATPRPAVRIDFATALTIQPESILRISVEQDATLNGNYPVNEIGAINFGYIGPIILFNRTVEEAEAKIREVLIGRMFKDATVAVEILRASYDRVSVVGNVNRPGIIRIGAGDRITLNDALLRAGGLQGVPGGMRVRVIRDGLTDSLAAAQPGEVHPLVSENGTSVVHDLLLGNNDKVILFSSRTQASTVYGEKVVTVLGEVHRPGVVRFSDAEPSTLMHLVFKMGGFPPYANRRAIRILRLDERGLEREIVVDARRVMETGHPDDDALLEHGDRIIVPARRISLF